MVKTPEQWLEETAPEKKQAIVKLFLGYAPGVGKTFNMLSEGIRRHSRGEDVIIGVVETNGRAGITELVSKLETVPRRQFEYKGAQFDEMDLDAILARKPRVVLVDELAHTDIEGSKHAKRYQDEMDLLDAHIDVLSTMNVQHIESLMPTVMNITGIQVRETVPDWVMQRVNEIVLADLTPEALQTRMRRGDIYPVERAERALGHFFKPANPTGTARREVQAGRCGDFAAQQPLDLRRGRSNNSVHWHQDDRHAHHANWARIGRHSEESSNFNLDDNRHDHSARNHLSPRGHRTGSGSLSSQSQWPDYRQEWPGSWFDNNRPGIQQPRIFPFAPLGSRKWLGCC